MIPHFCPLLLEAAKYAKVGESDIRSALKSGRLHAWRLSSPEEPASLAIINQFLNWNGCGREPELLYAKQSELHLLGESINAARAAEEYARDQWKAVGCSNKYFLNAVLFRATQGELSLFALPEHLRNDDQRLCYRYLVEPNCRLIPVSREMARALMRNGRALIAPTATTPMSGEIRIAGLYLSAEEMAQVSREWERSKNSDAEGKSVRRDQKYETEPERRRLAGEAFKRWSKDLHHNKNAACRAVLADNPSANKRGISQRVLYGLLTDLIKEVQSSNNNSI